MNREPRSTSYDDGFGYQSNNYNNIREADTRFKLTRQLPTYNENIKHKPTKTIKPTILVQ